MRVEGQSKIEVCLLYECLVITASLRVNHRLIKQFIIFHYTVPS